MKNLLLFLLLSLSSFAGSFKEFIDKYKKDKNITNLYDNFKTKELVKDKQTRLQLVLSILSLYEENYKDKFQEILNLFLVQGFNINTKDELGSSLLNKERILLGDINTIKFLLDQENIDINHVDKYGNKPLGCLITSIDQASYQENNDKLKKYIETAKILIEKGADVNFLNRDEDNVLDLALSLKMSNTAIEFIKYTFSKVEEKVNLGDTGIKALMRIAKNQTIKNFWKDLEGIINSLLKKGVDLNAANKDNESVVFIAARNGNKEMVELLWEQVIKEKDNWILKQNILHIFAVMGWTELIEKLVKSGNIDLNIKAKEGNTPIFNAVWCGHIDTVKYLVKNGGDINCVCINIYNKKSQSLLDAAISQYTHNSEQDCRLEMVKYLIKNTNINDPKNSIMDKVKGHLPVIKELIKYGIDINDNVIVAVINGGYDGDCFRIIFANGFSTTFNNKIGTNKLLENRHNKIKDMFMILKKEDKDRFSNYNSQFVNGDIIWVIASYLPDHKTYVAFILTSKETYQRTNEIIEALIKNGIIKPQNMVRYLCKLDKCENIPDIVTWENLEEESPNINEAYNFTLAEYKKNKKNKKQEKKAKKPKKNKNRKN